MMPNEIEDFIKASFEENYERLRLESGSNITRDVRVAALEQVLLYYRKMREVAETITETEVQLTLPEQRTPEGRRFTLEGVVDIVRELETTTMYDLKTHFDCETARGHLGQYEDQLNVYAHIWHGLRGQPLDATAIIATKPTREVSAALRSGNAAKIESAVERWQPCLQIALEDERVNAVIEEFGAVVDRIENRSFEPPAVSTLLQPSRPGARDAFGVTVCRNCDARFSCSSFRQYAQATHGGKNLDAVIGYFLGDFGADFETTQWLDANMESLDLNALGERETEGGAS
jgi:hypothetical protein